MELITILIWKDRCQMARFPFPLFGHTVSPRPAYQAIRARALLESSQLIGRALNDDESL